jgi:hypothetical protein
MLKAENMAVLLNQESAKIMADSPALDKRLAFDQRDRARSHCSR